MIYCTLFNPAIDVIYSVDELQSGKTVTNVNSSVIPAGKGINVAHVVATLGHEVTVLGVVPENDRQRFSIYLNDHGIGAHLYPVEGNSRINTTILERKSGYSTHLSSQGLPLDASIGEAVIQLLKSHLHNGDIWALSGSIPDGFAVDCYMKLITLCNEAGVLTLFDSRSTPFSMGIRGKPTMIKPNLTELEEYFGEQIQGVHHIALKGKRLLDMGIDSVFISLGADGMIALQGNDCLLCWPPPTIDVVSTVGCGDALVAGLLVAHTRHCSFVESCRLAIACSASKARHQRPAEVESQEIWNLMEDVHIESV
ncbi:MAG: hexose kinase [Chitinivibrionales bacterium]|nr:hexose kinase [Chitinivibrionales bacterium]